MSATIIKLLCMCLVAWQAAMGFEMAGEEKITGRSPTTTRVASTLLLALVVGMAMVIGAKA